MRTFYYLSSCDTCRRILSNLSLDASIALVDIKKTPLDEVALQELHQRSGNYEALINKRAQLFKQRDLKNKSLSEVDFKELLLEHYTFLKRPVLLYDDQLFVGNSASTLAAAKAFLDEQ